MAEGGGEVRSNTKPWYRCVKLPDPLLWLGIGCAWSLRALVTAVVTRYNFKEG